MWHAFTYTWILSTKYLITNLQSIDPARLAIEEGLEGGTHEMNLNGRERKDFTGSLRARWDGNRRTR